MFPIINDFFFYPAKTLPSSETQGQSVGSENAGDKSLQVRAKEHLGTDSHRSISKNSSRCLLLIGRQKMLGIIVPNGRTVSPEFDRSPETGGFEVCMARIWFRARAVPVDTVLNKGNFTTKCGINKIICNTACCAMYLETSTHLRLKAQSRIWGQYSDFHKKKSSDFQKNKLPFSKKQTLIFKTTKSGFQKNKLRFSKNQTPIFKKTNSVFQKN